MIGRVCLGNFKIKYSFKYMSYKELVDIEKRKLESARILKKYPDRIPVIVTKTTKCSLPDIDKQKFLVPHTMTLGQFVYIIRKRIKLDSSKALFVMINNNLFTTSHPMSELYENEKEEDGFLYVVYSSENTFG